MPIEIRRPPPPEMPKLDLEGEEEGGRSPAPLLVFFILLAFLAVLRLLLGVVAVPTELIAPLKIVMTVIYVGVPILALFKAADYPWSTRLGFVFFVVGAVFHISFTILAAIVLKRQGFPAALAYAVAQVGLTTWCIGLGALLAALLKDKNLLLPVALFLASLDIFLVLTPVGFTRQLIESQPRAVVSALATIPQPSAKPTGGPAPPLAMIGPADFLFLGMFFIALFKFRMRTRATLYAVLPTLVLYLVMVLVLKDVSLGKIKLNALPALVPIGLCVLIVNWKEFKMNAEEKLSTAVVGAIALGIVMYGFLKPTPPPAAPALPSAGAQQR